MFLPLSDVSEMERRSSHRGISIPHQRGTVHKGRAEVLQIISIRRTGVLRELRIEFDIQAFGATGNTRLGKLDPHIRDEPGQSGAERANVALGG